MNKEAPTPITLDEIDYVLTHWPSEAEKQHIIDFFDGEKDKKERVRCVKKLLGNRGGTVYLPESYAGDAEGWLSKGFNIKRRRIGDVETATLRLTWTRVATRIASLINEGRFLGND